MLKKYKRDSREIQERLKEPMKSDHIWPKLNRKQRYLTSLNEKRNTKEIQERFKRNTRGIKKADEIIFGQN